MTVVNTRNKYPFEVRCPLHGSIPFNDRERAIIDHPLFQRLRSISQLGFASLVFPGATHTRLGHSLGVMHLAGQIFQQVISNLEDQGVQRLAEEEEAYCLQVVRFAGLLHDLGHPPFSHSYEAMLPNKDALPLPLDWYDHLDGTVRANHEDFSVAAVYALSQESPALLAPEEARDVCALIDGKVTPSPRLGGGSQPGSRVYPLLKQIISGEIDADRMDYLRRDAHYAGVAYGFFDLPRLIQSLGCRVSDAGWAMTLEQNALFSYENFLMARFHMAMQVYFHKTLLPFEYYLRKAVEEGEIVFALDGSLENFLEAREDRVYQELYRARDRRWSSRIINRQPATRLLQMQDMEDPSIKQTALTALKEAGIEVIHITEQRRLSNLDSQPHGANDPIFIRKNRLGRDTYSPLQEESVLLHHYNLLFTIESLYCDPADYDRGTAALKSALG